MATGTATVTAQTGPGNTVSSKVISDVKGLRYDLEHNMFYVDAGSPLVTSEFSLNAIATITHTIASGVHTITIST